MYDVRKNTIFFNYMVNCNDMMLKISYLNFNDIMLKINKQLIIGFTSIN